MPGKKEAFTPSKKRTFSERVIEAALAAKRKRRRVENEEYDKLPKVLAELWKAEKKTYMAQVEDRGYTDYDFDFELGFTEFMPSTDQIAEALPPDLFFLHKTEAEARREAKQDGVVLLLELEPYRKWNLKISFEATLWERWRDELDTPTR